MTRNRLYRPTRLAQVMKDHGIDTKKCFGQNFLIDGNIVEGILRGAEVGEEDVILEIGTGIGTLTEALALAAKSVFAVEIDTRLAPVLEDTLEGLENVEILFEDVLKVDLKEELARRFPGKKVKVVANLPYYVTTPILGALLGQDLPLSSITVMVQKEVAKRMVAPPGGKDYGALSVFVQYYSHAAIVLDVPRTVFYPAPRVDSAVIHMDLKENLPEGGEQFFLVVKAAFSKRRKTLLNALSSFEGRWSKDEVREALGEANIEENTRAEALDEASFLALAKALPKGR